MGDAEGGAWPQQRLAEVRAAGFAAVRWVIGEPDEAAAGRLAAAAGAAGVNLIALACARAERTNLAAAEPARRAENQAFVERLLKTAAAAGAAAVELAPARVGPPGGPSLCKYEDAELWAYEGLLAAAAAAEPLGVSLAVAGAVGGFLLSPAECRRFVDRVCSPWVGACLDARHVAVVGDPADWLASLGARTLLAVADPAAPAARRVAAVAPGCPVAFSGPPQEAAAFIASLEQEAGDGR
jgi:hexulose-6-phosphate isomerase